MSPVKPRKRLCDIGTLDKLEKQILGLKKPSPRCQVKKTCFTQVSPATATERQPINRAKMILDAALVNPAKYCVAGNRIPGRKDPLCIFDSKSDFTSSEQMSEMHTSNTTGKSTIETPSSQHIKEYLRRKKICLETSNKLHAHFWKRGFQVKSYYWQDIAFDSAEFEPPTNMQIYEDFPPLLAKDPYDVCPEGKSNSPPSIFCDGSLVHIDRLKNEQLSPKDWLKNHSTITKDMRREQVDLIMTISRQFNFGHGLGFHSVSVLDNFMSNSSARVVTPENFRLVSIAAFVASTVSRFGKDTSAIYRALLGHGYTQIPQIKQFTLLIQSSLALNCLEAPTALDFLDAHCKKWVVLRPHHDPNMLFSMDQVGIQSQRLLIQATKSYTVMTQTYASRLATAAILVACEILKENVCKLFPELQLSCSASEINDINVTMNWFRRVHRDSFKPKMAHKRPLEN